VQHRHAHDRCDDERRHDEEHHCEDDCLPGQLNVGHANEQHGRRHVQHEHEQVVEGDLHERVGAVAAEEQRPDKDHGGVGRTREEDQARNIRVAQGRVGDGRRVGHAEEEEGEGVHGEGLDEVVDDGCEGDGGRGLAHPQDGIEVDLDEHREDHDPQEHGHDGVDLGELRTGKRLGDGGYKVADEAADNHACKNPKGQVLIEEGDGWGWWRWRRRRGRGGGDLHGRRDTRAAPATAAVDA
jgi:hypothetical protein